MSSERYKGKSKYLSAISQRSFRRKIVHEIVGSDDDEAVNPNCNIIPKDYINVGSDNNCNQNNINDGSDNNCNQNINCPSNINSTGLLNNDPFFYVSENDDSINFDNNDKNIHLINLILIIVIF